MVVAGVKCIYRVTTTHDNLALSGEVAQNLDNILKGRGCSLLREVVFMYSCVNGYLQRWMSQIHRRMLSKSVMMTCILREGK